MKRFFIFLAILVLAIAVASGCSSSAKSSGDVPSVQTPASSSNQQQGPKVETKGRPVVLMFTADW